MTTPAGESADLTGRRWVFGAAVLDERSLELHVNGKRVTLERKPLEVLLYLLHHAGEVVTKDDLAENLWPGRILTDTVMTRCISVLRQALQDHKRTLIRTAHGFGYRLVARVRVEASAAPAVPALDFKVGDNPPTRPHWRLVERLGAGGHGEAWLARHDKTGDARVFKFALDPGALSSLKREITLYRLLHDSLGARAAIARILEWNLEEPPYFIEMEHVAGGNLQAWSDAQGGLAALALADRLELVAQIAEALAAAHSVGALHKDLKPGNVLVHVERGRPAIKLCDFGSGTVLDPQRLEALGITRLGFTRTVAGDPTSATPLYVAPEVIAGQPCTVQADIYALGILLYQVVTGDLRRALAPGWEADVEDELLREDITAAADGNPSRRLTDAAQLAERLRTLEQRREARAAEAAARQRAERVRRVQQELRRMRVAAVLLLGLTFAAVAGGIVAYQARNEAIAATATAKAVSAFLMEDVFRIDSGVFRPSESSYEVLLNRAAAEVGVRLRDQPKAAASVHTMLGKRYEEIGRYDTATAQYERAVELSTYLYGEAAETTLMALDRLASIYLESGRLEDAMAASGRLQTLWASLLHPSDLAMLVVRARRARTIRIAGMVDEAEAELRAIIREPPNSTPPTQLAMTLLQQWLGVTPPPDSAASVLNAYAKLLLGGLLEESADGYAEPIALLRESLTTFATTLGDEAELTTLTRFALVVILAGAGEFEEAEALARRVRDVLDRSLPAGHYAQALSRLALGRLRVEQQRHAEARILYGEAVDLCKEERCPPRIRAELLWNQGRAYVEEGRGAEAIEILRSALAIQGQVFSAAHEMSLLVRVDLAEALRQAGSPDEGLAVLSTANQSTITALKSYQQTRADLHRVQGLLLLQKKHLGPAIAHLEESLKIVAHRFGANHWRSTRVRSELEAAKRVLAPN